MVTENELVRIEDICIRDEPPACESKCPMHVNVRELAALITDGNFEKAYKVFQKTIPFPGIISESCGGDCERACLRSSSGGALQIRELEKACVAYGYKPTKKPLIIRKTERAAVIGGGMCGISAAYYLARKGYGVSLFESAGRLGGYLHNLIAPEIIESEASILRDIGVELHFNNTIEDISQLTREYDAVCDCTGEFDLTRDEVTFQAKDNVFTCGAEQGYSSVRSLSNGARLATSVERFLQKVSLTVGREKEGSRESRLYVNTKNVPMSEPVTASGSLYSKDEAVLEASRCINCQCDECVKNCAFLTYYKTNPKKFIREARNCLAISVGSRFANKAINTCAECSQCASVCPVGLDTGKLCAEARRQMVKTNRMPPSAHEFALNDLEHSNGERYFLARHQNGHESSSYVYFPGCQLGAIAPEAVKSSYSNLCESLNGGVGLILGCCGEIAEWAGREELFNETLRQITDAWSMLGKPEIITACPTCYKIFKEHISEARVTGIWEVLESIGLPEIKREHMRLAVHDTCSTRGEIAVHLSVRRLLAEMGIEIEELENSGEFTQCCGYGGLMNFANHEAADMAAVMRSNQSGVEFAVYCINCRDRFSSNGKKVYHLLELVYGGYNDGFKQIGWSERRLNREKLKNELLSEVWGMETETQQENRLYMEDAVRDSVEKRRILLSDIGTVIDFAESTGKKLQDKETGCNIASKKIGNVTFWVWYEPYNDGYAVYKAYNHRMVIEGMQ